jgi:hypothetical protein
LLKASAAIVESNNQTVPPGSLQEQNETPRDVIMIAGGTPAFRGYRMTKPVSVRAGQVEFAKVTADELISEGGFCAQANLTILFQATLYQRNNRYGYVCRSYSVH